jgi:hypothetical protein
MQAVQLTVWKSPPQMRDVHDLDPGPMAEAQLDDLVELSKALANPTPIQIQERPAPPNRPNPIHAGPPARRAGREHAD